MEEQKSFLQVKIVTCENYGVWRKEAGSEVALALDEGNGMVWASWFCSSVGCNEHVSGN